MADGPLWYLPGTVEVSGTQPEDPPPPPRLPGKGSNAGVTSPRQAPTPRHRRPTQKISLQIGKWTNALRQLPEAAQRELVDSWLEGAFAHGDDRPPESATITNKVLWMTQLLAEEPPSIQTNLIDGLCVATYIKIGAVQALTPTPVVPDSATSGFPIGSMFSAHHDVTPTPGPVRVDMNVKNPTPPPPDSSVRASPGHPAASAATPVNHLLARLRASKEKRQMSTATNPDSSIDAPSKNGFPWHIVAGVLLLVILAMSCAGFIIVPGGIGVTWWNSTGGTPSVAENGATPAPEPAAPTPNPVAAAPEPTSNPVVAQPDATPAPPVKAVAINLKKHPSFHGAGPNGRSAEIVTLFFHNPNSALGAFGKQDEEIWVTGAQPLDMCLKDGVSQDDVSWNGEACAQADGSVPQSSEGIVHKTVLMQADNGGGLVVLPRNKIADVLSTRWTRIGGTDAEPVYAKCDDSGRRRDKVMGTPAACKPAPAAINHGNDDHI